jgi:hypothetical protein
MTRSERIAALIFTLLILLGAGLLTALVLQAGSATMLNQA